jgi:hypothetical protein
MVMFFPLAGIAFIISAIPKLGKAAFSSHEGGFFF